MLAMSEIHNAMSRRAASRPAEEGLLCVEAPRGWEHTGPVRAFGDNMCPSQVRGNVFEEEVA